MAAKAPGPMPLPIRQCATRFARSFNAPYVKVSWLQETQGASGVSAPTSRRLDARSCRIRRGGLVPFHEHLPLLGLRHPRQFPERPIGISRDRLQDCLKVPEHSRHARGLEAAALDIKVSTSSVPGHTIRLSG